MQGVYSSSIVNFTNIHRHCSKNTPEYKSYCLIMYIITGFDYWHTEGTSNHDIIDNIQNKEIENE